MHSNHSGITALGSIIIALFHKHSKQICFAVGIVFLYKCAEFCTHSATAHIRRVSTYNAIFLHHNFCLSDKRHKSSTKSNLSNSIKDIVIYIFFNLRILGFKLCYFTCCNFEVKNTSILFCVDKFVNKFLCCRFQITKQLQIVCI